MIAKVNLAASSTVPLRREVHKRSELDANDKALLADAITRTQLTYNASTWPPLNLAQERHFAHQYVANYAAAQGISWKVRKANEITYVQIVEGVQRMPHQDFLRLERLRLLVRVLHHGALARTSVV